MSVEIKIPEMGESISDVTIGEIFKGNGQEIEEGGEILEIETDKVNQSLFAPKSGIITLTVAKGDVVKVGQTIGFIEEKNVSMPNKAQNDIEKKAEKNLKEELPKESKQDVITPKEPIKESKIEAPKEIIQKEAKIESSKKEERKPLSPIRKVIGERLVKASHEMASLTTFNEVDMSAIISLREEYQELFMKKHQVKLGFLSFFIKATVFSLKTFPIIHSRIEKDEIVRPHDYDIGIAVATDKGLFVPVIRNCEKLSFYEIEMQIAEYAKKARSGALVVGDLTGGSFTITNGGVYGSLFSTPLINPPQSAILGMHNIVKRPVAIEDQIEIRPMMYIALSYDHRLIDGKEAVSFLVNVKEHLEEPSRLLIDI